MANGAGNADDDRGFPIAEQAKLDYQAGQNLAQDYYIGGPGLASILITFAAGVLAASIGLLDDVAPLDSTSADWILYLGWFLLALSVLGGLLFLLIGRASQLHYFRYLSFNAQSVRTDEDQKEHKAKARLEIRRSIACAERRDKSLVATLVVLIGALSSLGVYVAVATSGTGPAVSDVIVEDVNFVEDLPTQNECLATVDLAFPNESTDVAFYTIVNDELVGKPQKETDQKETVCIKLPEELKDVSEGPVKVEIVVDKASSLNTAAFEAGRTKEIRSQGEVIAIQRYKTEPGR